MPSEVSQLVNRPLSSNVVEQELQYHYCYQYGDIYTYESLFKCTRSVRSGVEIALSCHLPDGNTMCKHYYFGCCSGEMKMSSAHKGVRVVTGVYYQEDNM